MWISSVVLGSVTPGVLVVTTSGKEQTVSGCRCHQLDDLVVLDMVKGVRNTWNDHVRVEKYVCFSNLLMIDRCLHDPSK